MTSKPTCLIVASAAPAGKTENIYFVYIYCITQPCWIYNKKHKQELLMVIIGILLV